MGLAATHARRRIPPPIRALIAGTTLGALLFPAASLSASASSSTAPLVTVTSPVRFESEAAGLVQFNGRASSPAGIRSVQIRITNLATNQLAASANAVLGAPTSGMTPWSYTWQPIGAYPYTVRVQAVDKKGATSAPVIVEFDVADASGSSFLTLMFGRSPLAIAGPNCQPLSDTVPLDQVAATLKSMNLPGTGSVLTSYIGDGTNTCIAGALASDLYPSWQQLATLRDSYGMTFVSEGVNNVDLRTLSAQQQEADICGSLPILAAQGHTRAWGLFAYTDNHFTASIQTGVTANCFAFGRSYLFSRNHDTVLPTSPWYATVFSLLGGACNAPNLPCYSLQVIGPNTGKETRYQSPLDMRTMMTAGPGEWTIVQMYTFVSGSYNVGGTGLQWNCNGPNWQTHYTTAPETYCWNDYLYALASLPNGVTVADPATVAQTFAPDNSVPTPTIQSRPANPSNQNSATFTFNSSEARSWFQCSLDGAPNQLCDSGVSYTNLPDGVHTFNLTATDAAGNTGTTSFGWTQNTAGASSGAPRQRTSSLRP